MDKAAGYVALYRATSLEKLYLVEPVVLADLQHKPDADVLATLDFLHRLDIATASAFFKDPSVFHPVSVQSVAEGYKFSYPSCWNGQGGVGLGGHPPAATFIPPNHISNCFHNAAVASTIAAFDGQPLPCGSSCSPSAKVFFAAVGAVRASMHTGHTLPDGILVRFLPPVCLLFYRCVQVPQLRFLLLHQTLNFRAPFRSHHCFSTRHRTKWPLRVTLS